MADIIDKLVTLIDYKTDTKGIKTSEQALKGLEKETEKANEVVEMLKKSLELVGLALGVEKVLDYAGEWETAGNKLRSVGLTGKQLIDVQDKLLSMSERTGTSLESNAELYQQLSASMQGVTTQAQRLTVVDTLTKIFAMSGATTAQTEAAISDMSRALEGSTVRWQEIRRAMQDIPKLQNVISAHFKKMGTTYSDALQGNKFATADFINILEQENKEVSKNFAQMRRTIPQSLNALKQSLIAFFGTMLDNIGISSMFASVIDAISNGLTRAAKFFQDNAKEVKKWGTVVATAISIIAARFVYLNASVILPFLLRTGALLLPLIAIGLSVQDFITYIEGGDSILGRFLNWLGISRSAAKKLGEAILIATGTFAAYKAMVIAVAAASKVYEAVLAGVTAAQWALDAAMDANPIGLIVIGIALLTGALIYLQYKYQIFTKALKGLNVILGYVTGSFKYMYDEIMKVVHAIDTLISKLNIVGKVKSIGSEVIGGAEKVGGGIEAGFSRVYHFFTGYKTPVAPVATRSGQTNINNNISVNVTHGSTTATAQEIANSTVDKLSKTLQQSYRQTALGYANGVKA